MDGNSNRTWKRHNRVEWMVVSALEVESGPVIGFGLGDLEGVTTPYSNALIIRATMANYDIARIFVDVDSLINVLFWEALE